MNPRGFSLEFLTPSPTGYIIEQNIASLSKLSFDTFAIDLAVYVPRQSSITNGILFRYQCVRSLLTTSITESGVTSIVLSVSHLRNSQNITLMLEATASSGIISTAQVSPCDIY